MHKKIVCKFLYKLYIDTRFFLSPCPLERNHPTSVYCQERLMKSITFNDVRTRKRGQTKRAFFE